MGKLLLAAAVAGGLMAGTATAAPTVGAVGYVATAPQHVVQADYYWHHRHWHHRHYYHGGWRYW
jgi:hypothetical protein